MIVDLIRQRTDFDCGVCTIAMATGRSYEDVWQAAIEEVGSGRGVRNEQKALERLGLSYRFDRGEPVGDFVCRHRGILDPKFFRGFAWGRRAILAVPSLNQSGNFHSVYWDGNAIFDPSPNLVYESWHDLLPEELVLFRER